MPSTEEITVRKSSTTGVSPVPTPGHQTVLRAIRTTNSRALCQMKHTRKALAVSSTKKRFWIKEPVSFQCELSSQAQMFKRLVLSQFVWESTGSFGGGVAARSREPSHRPLRVAAWPHFHFEQSSKMQTSLLMPLPQCTAANLNTVPSLP